MAVIPTVVGCTRVAVVVIDLCGMNRMLLALAFEDTSCDWIAVVHRNYREIGGSRHIAVAVVLPVCIVDGRHGVRVVLGQAP